MAVDARGAKGQPIFLGAGADDQAADLTILGEEIYERGTRLVLTESEMDDLVTAGLAYDGLAVFCTTDTREYVRLSGQWKRIGAGLLASGTITAQSTFSIDGLTGYDRYEVTLILTASSAAQGIGARLRAGGSDDSGANYDLASSASQLAQTSWQNLLGAGRFEKTVRVLLLNLNRAEKTFGESTVTGWNTTTDPTLYAAGLRHRLASVFDGITFITTGGTVTGRYEVRAL